MNRLLVGQQNPQDPYLKSKMWREIGSIGSRRLWKGRKVGNHAFARRGGREVPRGKSGMGELRLGNGVLFLGEGSAIGGGKKEEKVQLSGEGTRGA